MDFDRQQGHAAETNVDLKRRYSRRDFLTSVTAAGGAALLGLQTRGETQVGWNPVPGAVVRYFDPKFGEGDFDVTRAKRALDESICALTKLKKPVTAWSRLFTPGDVVAIKINCLGGPNLSTRPGLVQAIIQNLTSAGVKPDNIIVFDMKNRELTMAGFSLSQAAGTPRVAGSDALGGYDTNFTQQGTVATRLSKVVSTLCTAIINVPILKDHKIVGVTAAMKNYFGVIDNPNKYHGNHGDPHVADVYSIPVIRGKERLIICDALNASFEGGPAYEPKGVWRPSCLLMATDPVAHDYVAWLMVEAERQRRGLQPLAKEGRSPKYLLTAANAGLGSKSPRVIDLQPQAA
ncbi:MAG: DUF362 domain-containing protein [Armatimonadetes bacterium]|nr:DUF362 domain-containing protein [Armatimonadota bacterium]